MDLFSRSGWLRGFGLVLVVAVFVFSGCAGGTDTSGDTPEETSSTGGDGIEEPRHNGRLVELSGENTAELLVVAGGMTYVYLYDTDGNPVEFAGKEVSVVFTTADGESQTLVLNGMGVGAGAHFMNPIDEAMVERIMEQGAYMADITVTSESGTQTGSIEITVGG